MSVKQKDQLMSLAEANNSTGIFTKSEVLKIILSGLSKPMWFFKEEVGRNQFNPSMVGQVVQMPW